MVRFSFVMCLVAAAACGGGSKAKGGGAKGQAAQSANQKAGGGAEGDHSKGTDKGAMYEGVTCDSSTDGLAWCDSDTEIAVCAGGEWWLLDCSSDQIGGDFCGDDGATVDCYLASEF
jgi:hypothetical protein